MRRNEWLAQRLRFTTVGLLSGKDLKRRNSTIIVGSDCGCSSSVALKSALILYVRGYMRKPHSRGQLLFQHIQNCRGRLVVLLRLGHPVEYSHETTLSRHLILGMTLHFIATQALDSPFEFLVHIFRALRFRISSRAKSVVNGLQRTLKKW